jgi:arylsulfatase A-like enzyme
MSRSFGGFVSLAVLPMLVWHALAGGRSLAAQPNVVIIFTDDQGYGDLGCFGSQTIRTPNIDRLAREGRKFTSFMVASPVCTPSRAALLTGCYPKRVGLHQHVLFPTSTKGLHPAEYTIADHLKSLGYATACFGKWHLGHQPQVLPRAQGFDRYFGIPYSNDMNHPDNKGRPEGGPDGMDALWRDPDSTLTRWRTPLVENEAIVELPVDQRTITRRYTQRAIEFLTEHRDRPFFLYLPHSMPHIPLYVPDEVRDPDPGRAYANTIEHIDREVGRLLDAIDALDLADDTFVIYTTDNGPWLPFRHHGGSAGPLRDGKGTTFEGGQRVPCLIRGPGIPAGTVCDGLTGTIDILPTLAALVGRPLPEAAGPMGRPIDGLDVSRLWRGETDRSPREEFLYYSAHGVIEGIRQGDWKLLVKRPRKADSRKGGAAPAEDPQPERMLFDLARDIGERNNLAAEHPAIVTRLERRLTECDAAITRQARAPWMAP